MCPDCEPFTELKAFARKTRQVHEDMMSYDQALKQYVTTPSLADSELVTFQRRLMRWSRSVFRYTRHQRLLDKRIKLALEAA